VKPGDEVVPDQEIIDVETNKAVMGVTTPCKGKIDKITVQIKETYPVGAVLGYVERAKKTPPVQENGARTSERNSGNGNPGRDDRPAWHAAKKVESRPWQGLLPVSRPACLKGRDFHCHCSFRKVLAPFFLNRAASSSLAST